MRIDEVLDDWSFYLDPNSEFHPPYLDRWLPILGNGSSDYLVYDLETRAIHEYWHDNPDRAVVHATLEDWAIDTLNQLAGSSAGSIQGGRRVATDPPQTLTLMILPGAQAKDLALVRELHSLTSIPLPLVMKAMAPANTDVFLEFALAQAANSMAQSSMVRTARKAVAQLVAKGHAPRLFIHAGAGDAEAATIEDLEALELRCLTG